MNGMDIIRNISFMVFCFYVGVVVWGLLFCMVFGMEELVEVLEEVLSVVLIFWMFLLFLVCEGWFEEVEIGCVDLILLLIWVLVWFVNVRFCVVVVFIVGCVWFGIFVWWVVGGIFRLIFCFLVCKLIEFFVWSWYIEGI